ncbi:MAG: family 1 glycosylhydrolase [Actinomycetota bacterium]
MGITEGFIWGTTSSSTQCEGAAPESDWADWESRGLAPRSGDGNGFATHFAEDFRLYASYGLTHHRLSVEWARIEPAEGRRDDAVVEHYRAVLEAARAAGVAPWLCLHHVTLPGWFTELGEGAFRDDRARSYHWARHVAFCAETFGDLVAGWQPIDEPTAYAAGGYLTGTMPPGDRDPEHFAQALRGMVLAWRDAWRELRGGPPVATMLDLSPVFPVDESVPAARHARATDAVLWTTWVRALRDGLLAVPGLPEVEVPDLRDSADLIGFSYSSALGVGRDGTFLPYPSNRRTTALGHAPWPEGLGLVLRRLHEELDGRPLLIGALGLGTDDDAWRCDHLRECVAVVDEAIADGVDVRGLLHRTGVDEYEWSQGYSVPFGLFTRDREPRESALVAREFATR